MFEPKTTHPNLRIYSFHILDTFVDTEATKITDSIYTVSWSFVKLSSRFVRFRSNLAEATWRSYCCNHFLGSIDQFETNLDRLSPTVSSSPSRHPSPRHASPGYPSQRPPARRNRSPCSPTPQSLDLSSGTTTGHAACLGQPELHLAGDPEIWGPGLCLEPQTKNTERLGFC